MNAPFPLGVEEVAVVDMRDPGEVARIEQFVAECEGTVFHRPAWLHAVEQGTGQRATGLVAEKGGIVTGWLPLTEAHSPLFGRALVSSGFAVGGGALTRKAATANALCKAAEELAVRQSCSSIELRGGVFPAEWDEIADRHAGFVRPLEDDDEAQLLAIPRKQRAEIRKSLKGALTVETGTSERDRAAHYAVYSESVRNLGTPVFPRALFDAMLDHFGDNADIMNVYRDGMPVSSVLSLYHDGVVMPYWGGGIFAARHLRANERMYYELMRHARRRGCGLFDFGRSKTGSGPYAYKKNWGFDPRPLTYGVWSDASGETRQIDPGNEAYSSKIALWKKLPLAVANRVGPHIAKGLA